MKFLACFILLPTFSFSVLLLESIKWQLISVFDHKNALAGAPMQRRFLGSIFYLHSWEDSAARVSRTLAFKMCELANELSSLIESEWSCLRLACVHCSASVLLILLRGPEPWKTAMHGWYGNVLFYPISVVITFAKSESWVRSLESWKQGKMERCLKKQ